MYQRNRRKNKKLKTVKSLTYLCKRKLFDAYMIEENFLWLSHFNWVVYAFQNMEKTLSKQVFVKKFGNEDNKFDKFIWFVHKFIWNKDVNFRIKDYNVSISANWAMTSQYDKMSEINFVGCNYLDGKISFVLDETHYQDPSFTEIKINPKRFNYQPNFRFETRRKCHRQICLTVIDQEWLYMLKENNFRPRFFEMNSGKVFDFITTIKRLGYPAFEIKASTYNSLMLKISCELVFSLNLNFWDCPNNTPCFLRIVNQYDKSLKNSDKKNTKKCMSNLDKLLNSYSFLEEVQLNLFDVPSEQKVSIIENLNKNLKSLKLVYFQPISFLLHVGTKLNKLETLDVWYVKEKFNVCVRPNVRRVKPCTYFDKLNNESLVAFKNLKCFKIKTCNRVRGTFPLLLETILTVLKYCQTTLTRFHLKSYWFDDVNKIVDFICSINMPLKVLKFKKICYLTDEDLMKLVKVMNSSELNIRLESANGGVEKFAKVIKSTELVIKIKECRLVTPQGLQNVLSYIEENNLGIKIKHDKVLA